MIDFHSHFLPGMDDGSASVEESVQMLLLSKKQGVDVIVATPHFDAYRDDLSDFLQRRRISLEKIRHDPSSMPEMICGAEVAYFTGIGKSREMKKLCIGSTQLLLVEMPFHRWSARQVEDVCALTQQGIIPVIAHIDRYLHTGQLITYLPALAREGVCFQCNADAFLRSSSARRVAGLLKKGYIHFLGSDCHNMQNRPSRIDEAMQIVEQKLGAEFLQQLDASAKALLCSSE